MFHEHADTISDSSKQVDASNKPITYTHIVKGINNLLYLRAHPTRDIPNRRLFLSLSFS